MNYELEFHPKALREWNKLGDTIKKQFKTKLVERLDTPRIATAKLSGYPDLYKIKLRGAGYRLVYKVFNERLVVYVLTIGKRERKEVYLKIDNRT